MGKMKELYQKVAGDDNLRTKFMEIIDNVENLETREIQKQLLDFAKGAGYDIRIEEMDEFFSDLDEKQDELSESELDMVAGGKGNGGSNVKELVRRTKKRIKHVSEHPESLL